MTTWHDFPEPPRKHNGKLIRVLKMLAKGFAFAHEDQKEEFVSLFETAFDAHCELAIAGKFSTFQMVLGQTVRGDILNFKDGNIIKGQRALYNGCIDALRELHPVLCQKLQSHMEA